MIGLHDETCCYELSGTVYCGCFRWAGPPGPGEGQTSLPDEPDKTSLEKQYLCRIRIFIDEITFQAVITLLSAGYCEFERKTTGSLSYLSK